MNLKITPLIIFLVMLTILIVFTMICKLPFMQEGFISFQQSSSEGSREVIPQYNSSERPYKLYDSMYFDNINGNLIEVDSPAYVTGNVDLTGNTISSISVLIQLMYILMKSVQQIKFSLHNLPLLTHLTSQ